MDKATTPPQQNQQPSLCIGNCGFFGNEKFMNMCSQCYAKSTSTSTATATMTASTTTTTTTPSATTNLTNSPITTIQQQSVAIPAASSPPQLPLTHNDITGSSYGSSVDVQLSSISPPQTTKSSQSTGASSNRCQQCKVKLNVAKQVSNRCKCGQVFCDQHKHAASHQCQFDYSTAQKQLLEKKNPRVVAERGSFTRIE